MSGVSDILGDRYLERHDAIALYWPIKDEPDLRPLMTSMHRDGQRMALPVVEHSAAPLVFRERTPETRMDRGVWNIPVPPRTAPPVQPVIVLVPLLGWDGEGYRLGYGGGYFDCTLAALTPRPFCIGIGLAAARLSTIFPQPHDIPFDAILTEHGVEFERKPEHGQRTGRARTR
jgi:5,10-methenyltetrahydrofolate synthetase